MFSPFLRFGTLLLMLGGVVLILLWSYVWNYGEIEVTGAAPFTISLPGSGIISCAADPCQEKVKPGEYLATFSKKGYFNIQKTVTIPYRQTVYMHISFALIPTYQQITAEEFQKKQTAPLFPIPEDLKNIPARDLSFSSSGNLLYFNPETSEIKLRQNGQEKLLAEFFSVHDVLLDASPDNRFLVMRNNSGAYLIDAENGAKQKFSAEAISKILWNGNGSQFIFEKFDQKLFIFDVSDLNFTPLLLNLPLKNIVWDSPDQLIIATGDGFSFYDLRTKTTIPFMSGENLTIKALFLSPDKKNLYFDTGEAYYALRFRE